MIVDTLEHIAQYENVNPYFKEVVAFLKGHDLNALEPGIHKIKGDDVYVNITTTKGKAPDEAVLETHIKMIDIQIPLDAPETYGYTPLERLQPADYNAEKDITKYPGVLPECFIDCQPGMFAVFFPQDGHAPCISLEPQFKKAIFKVRV